MGRILGSGARAFAYKARAGGGGGAAYRAKASHSGFGAQDLAAIMALSKGIIENPVTQLVGAGLGKLLFEPSKDERIAAAREEGHGEAHKRAGAALAQDATPRQQAAAGIKATAQQAGGTPAAAEAATADALAAMEQEALATQPVSLPTDTRGAGAAPAVAQPSQAPAMREMLRTTLEQEGLLTPGDVAPSSQELTGVAGAPQADVVLPQQDASGGVGPTPQGQITQLQYERALQSRQRAQEQGLPQGMPKRQVVAQPGVITTQRGIQGQLPAAPQQQPQVGLPGLQAFQREQQKVALAGQEPKGLPEFLPSDPVALTLLAGDVRNLDEAQRLMDMAAELAPNTGFINGVLGIDKDNARKAMATVISKAKTARAEGQIKLFKELSQAERRGMQTDIDIGGLGVKQMDAQTRAQVGLARIGRMEAQNELDRSKTEKLKWSLRRAMARARARGRGTKGLSLEDILKLGKLATDIANKDAQTQLRLAQTKKALTGIQADISMDEVKKQNLISQMMDRTASLVLETERNAIARERIAATIEGRKAKARKKAIEAGELAIEAEEAQVGEDEFATPAQIQARKSGARARRLRKKAGRLGAPDHQVESRERYGR